VVVLQWLPQGLDDMPLELGKFIQKEHAMMGEGGFARSRIAATAYQSGVRYGVMRGAERPLVDDCDTRR
jgi:hypothetical protein